ncbi:MAG: sugar transferase [Candidatus Zhuqueibacterota bacterium]
MHNGDNIQLAYELTETSWVKLSRETVTEEAYLGLKRLLDIVLAGLFLILVLPLVIVIAVVIKLDTRGPIFFRQIRIGQNRRYLSSERNEQPERRVRNLKGNPFQIYKFRTMNIEAEKYGWIPKGSGDSRLTRAGKILRATSLDELPQLINVLKGDMSLVGPRPEMPFIVEHYSRLDAVRLNVKPGITGLWQINNTRAQKIHENLEYDLDYIENRSLWFDLKIMMKTFLYMLLLRNA